MTQALKAREFGVMRSAGSALPRGIRFQWDTFSEETSMGKFIGDYLERGALGMALLMLGSGLGMLLVASQSLAFLVRALLS